MNTGFKCTDTKPVVSFGVFSSAFLGLKCHYLCKKGWYKQDHCSVTRELSNNYILLRRLKLHGIKRQKVPKIHGLKKHQKNHSLACKKSSHF